MKRHALALAVGLALSGAAYAEPLTIDSIIQLSKVGLSDEAIVAKIDSEDARFDLTTDQMIALKRQGVSSAVITAMIGSGEDGPVELSMTSPDPMVPHPAGFYIIHGTGAEAQTQRIDATVSSQAKTGGIFGYALTGGIASASVKVAISNETAPTTTQNHAPRFLMFLDEANNVRSTSTWASGMNTAVTSPAELILIRLKQKDGRREARVGSMNLAGVKTGVMDEDRIAFRHRMIRPGVYEIAVPTLESGQYGFIFSLAGGGTGGAMSARIFDFTVL